MAKRVADRCKRCGRVICLGREAAERAGVDSGCTHSPKHGGPLHPSCARALWEADQQARTSSNARAKRFEIRLSDEEHEKIQRIAAWHSMDSFAEVFRWLLDHEADWIATYEETPSRAPAARAARAAARSAGPRRR